MYLLFSLKPGPSILMHFLFFFYNAIFFTKDLEDVSFEVCHEKQILQKALTYEYLLVLQICFVTGFAYSGSAYRCSALIHLKWFRKFVEMILHELSWLNHFLLSSLSIYFR